MRAYPRLVRASLLVAVIVAGFLVAVAVSRADEAKKPGAVVVLSRADAGVSMSSAAGAQPDPYLWLEDVDGTRSMDWVRAHNAATAKKLESQPIYKELYANALAALDSASRLPAVTQRGRWIYNFWKDDKHPRGIYRRATLDEFRQPEPQWQTVLDVDALATKEGKPWVFHGMSCLQPTYKRCLVELSPGGGDAEEIRELDSETLAFVPDGFTLPTAKTNIAWRDENSVFVGTDFGPGSLTDSGYPRIVKLWQRGTPIAQARTIYEGKQTAVSANGFRLRSKEGDVDLVSESPDFWTNTYQQLVGDKLEKLDLPATAEVSDIFRGRLIVSLKEDWQRGDQIFKQDSVLIADPAALRGGAGKVDVLVEAAANEVVEDVDAAESGILVTMLDSVRGRLYRYEPTSSGETVGGEVRHYRGWSRRAIPFPDNGALGVTSVDASSGDAFVKYESFTTPPTLYYVPDANPAPEQVKQQQPTFDGSKFEVTQQWTTSADGTKVPYFQVAPKGMALDGSHPAHIFSYGGFRNELVPSYSGSYEQLYGAYGKMWLERGGVFVLANIRGGGEFGEKWHQGAVKANHVHAYEDFEAVAADLIARQVTSKAHLGIEGRSNGGLLVLSTMIRRPDLYGAVICGSPLADMRRFHKMLAGASWMAEYGDPDKPEEWAYISKYSPYQKARAGQGYPPIFFYLSTRDDRVHPGHARKMAARLEEQGYDVTYFEEIEGGHGASVTNQQLAHRLALSYTHLWNRLGGNSSGGT
jgi:prolyl oligopeptidase